MHYRIYIALVLSFFCKIGLGQNTLEADKLHIPYDLFSHGLIVEEFVYTDPKSEEYFGVFGEKDHPLLVSTNKNLYKYNNALLKAFHNYKGRYVISNSPDKFDAQTYRFILRKKVYLHQFETQGNMGEVVHSYYTYVYYFHDRWTSQDYEHNEIYYSIPRKSLNKLGRKLCRMSAKIN